MKSFAVLTTLGVCVFASAAAWAASSGPVFYGDAPDDHHPWAVHDRNRPQPKAVVPGTFSQQVQAGKPPADAIVLFDGTDLSKWESTKDGSPAKWLVRDGYMEVAKSAGSIRSKDKFGDCQLHVEWSPPAKVEGESQGRGNSGVFLEDRLEIQVLDSYNNITYADGHAGAYYGINPPMALPLNPPGQWQVYDIVFRRPVYKDGQPLDPGYITVFLNGVLVQDHTPLEGPGGHMGRTKAGPFPAKGPLQLQDHGNPTRFRNIWYRELPPRAVEGGTDGPLTVEATMAKRKEIAATIRQDAARLKNPANPLPEMFRVMESLEYEKDAAAYQQAEQMAGQYVAGVKGLSPEQVKAKKDEILQVAGAMRFLTKFKVIPANYAPRVALEQIIRDNALEKRR